jgi:hypothetical protein
MALFRPQEQLFFYSCVVINAALATQTTQLTDSTEWNPTVSNIGKTALTLMEGGNFTTSGTTAF